ncbi:MAG: triose-phosphate isomerase [Syntrophobacterales bacterium]|jgi:triosephosphate isomerase|nr:triose-phosphate isomerase [Syntrophobacterales bacterium]
MRNWMVAGNWKMYNTIPEATTLAAQIREGMKGITGGEVVVAPAFTALAATCDIIKGSSIILAAQNMFYEEKGAYTGEISLAMLKDAGCTYVIIGHSERRKYFHESDENVNLKVKKCLAAELKPIVCVGETLEEREQGVTEFVVGQQVRKAFYGLQSLNGVVIAYEPVWAIGTGKNALPMEAEETHRFIRHVIGDMFGEEQGSVRILYGGSVTHENIGDLIGMKDIDGALVGGASLKAESFLGIIEKVSEKR